VFLKAIRHCNGKSNSFGIRQFPFLGTSIGLITAFAPESRIGIAIWNHSNWNCLELGLPVYPVCDGFHCTEIERPGTVENRLRFQSLIGHLPHLRVSSGGPVSDHRGTGWTGRFVFYALLFGLHPSSGQMGRYARIIESLAVKGGVFGSCTHRELCLELVS
jgi:hypothetical protein